MPELEYEGWEIDFEGSEQEGMWDDTYTTEYAGNRIHHHSGLGHRNFASAEEAWKSAVRRAQDWIDMVGVTIFAMGCDTVVDISSPEAEEYPFRFHLEDRVRSTHGGSDEGVRKTGVYYGAASGGAYKTFYEIQRDDGMYFRSEESELEPLN